MDVSYTLPSKEERKIEFVVNFIRWKIPEISALFLNIGYRKIEFFIDLPVNYTSSEIVIESLRTLLQSKYSVWQYSIYYADPLSPVVKRDMIKLI